MKISLILTFFIVIGTIMVASWQKSEAGGLNAEYETLLSEVERLGVDTRDLTGENGVLSQMSLKQVITRIEAIDAKTARDVRTRGFAREIADFAEEQKKLARRGRPDTVAQAKIMRIMEGLLELEGEDFRVLLEAFRTDTGLSANSRQELIGMAVIMLGRQNPRSALDLLAESREDLLQGGRAGFMVGMCLQGLAQKDPAAALAWVDSHKDLVDDQAMRQALQGVAQKDPEMAMKRVLNQKDGDGRQNILMFASSMASAVTDQAGRESLIATMRKVSKASAPADAAGSDAASNPVSLLQDGILRGIGSRLTEGSFEQAKAWLESAAINAEEKAKVIEGIAGSLYSKDPAPWLEWMTANLPADKMSEKLQQIIPSWTNQDFNAVGAWLNGQPVSKAREQAVLSFAETLLPHEPEAAQRWLESLPESPKRQELMDKISGAQNPPPAEGQPADGEVPAPAPAPAPEDGAAPAEAPAEGR
ncbi:MAG: hypothetical protein JWM59_2206 [Verrucomicrobiales bacterium]|nr:hypothetical protein [Verrucomicrobiales bacterium]